MKHNIPTSFSIYWWRELHTSGKRPERQTETNTNRMFTSNKHLKPLYTKQSTAVEIMQIWS